MIHKPIGTRILIFATAALLAGALAMAQDEPGDTQNQPAQPQMPGQQSPTPTENDNPATGTPGMQESMSRSFADQVFVRRMLEHSSAEARIGLLAEEKSPSGDIRQFGQRVVLVHNQLLDQFGPIASQVNVRETQKLDKKQERDVEQLQALSGTAFDQAFIQLMVRYQRHDVREFSTEANVAQDPSIQRVAHRDAPASARRLTEIEQIAHSHNVVLAEK